MSNIGRARQLFRASCLVSIWLGLLLAFSCSSDAPPRGGLMLVVTKDGPLPLDRLEIQVSSGDQILLAQSYRLPEEAELPTTLAIASNGHEAAVVNLTVIGWHGSEPLDRRDAIVTEVPTDRVAMLTIVLSGRCSSKVTVDGDGKAVSTCGADRTCAPETGNCTSADVSATSLPDYTSGAEDTAGLSGSSSISLGGAAVGMAGGPSAEGGQSSTGGEIASSGGANASGGGATSTGDAGAGQGGSGETLSNAGQAGAAGAPPVSPCAGTTVCDTFEGYVGAPGAPWKVSASGTGVTVAMDSEHAFSGTKAVKLTLPGSSPYQRALIEITGSPSFPFPNDNFYGRMMFYVTALPTAVVHWTLAEGDGPITAQGMTQSMVSYGGLAKKLIANYNTTPQSPDCWQNSQTVMPEGRWVCVEWQFDGANDTQRLWLDGTSVADQTVVAKGQGCVQNNTDGHWYFPKDFTSAYLGYESFQADATQRTVWIDDAAIGPARIGCP